MLVGSDLFGLPGEVRWRPQSDRITPVIRTDVIESPFPPYVAAKFAPTKTAS